MCCRLDGWFMRVPFIEWMAHLRAVDWMDVHVYAVDRINGSCNFSGLDEQFMYVS